MWNRLPTKRFCATRLSFQGCGSPKGGSMMSGGRPTLRARSLGSQRIRLMTWAEERLRRAMRAGHELPQRGAHITSQQPAPESRTALQPHQGSAGTPRRTRPPHDTTHPHVTWNLDLWKNWLEDALQTY